MELQQLKDKVVPSLSSQENWKELLDAITDVADKSIFTYLKGGELKDTAQIMSSSDFSGEVYLTKEAFKSAYGALSVSHWETSDLYLYRDGKARIGDVNPTHGFHSWIKPTIIKKINADGSISDISAGYDQDAFYGDNMPWVAMFTDKESRDTISYYQLSSLTDVAISTFCRCINTDVSNHPNAFLSIVRTALTACTPELRKLFKSLGSDQDYIYSLEEDGYNVHFLLSDYSNNSALEYRASCELGVDFSLDNPRRHVPGVVVYNDCKVDILNTTPKKAVISLIAGDEAKMLTPVVINPPETYDEFREQFVCIDSENNVHAGGFLPMAEMALNGGKLFVVLNFCHRDFRFLELVQRNAFEITNVAWGCCELPDGTYNTSIGDITVDNNLIQGTIPSLYRSVNIYPTTLYKDNFDGLYRSIFGDKVFDIFSFYDFCTAVNFLGYPQVTTYIKDGEEYTDNTYSFVSNLQSNERLKTYPLRQFKFISTSTAYCEGELLPYQDESNKDVLQVRILYTNSMLQDLEHTFTLRVVSYHNNIVVFDTDSSQLQLLDSILNSGAYVVNNTYATVIRKMRGYVFGYPLKEFKTLTYEVSGVVVDPYKPLRDWWNRSVPLARLLSTNEYLFSITTNELILEKVASSTVIRVLGNDSWTIIFNNKPDWITIKRGTTVVSSGDRGEGQEDITIEVTQNDSTIRSWNGLQFSGTNSGVVNSVFIEQKSIGVEAPIVRGGVTSESDPIPISGTDLSYIKYTIDINTKRTVQFFIDVKVATNWRLIGPLLNFAGSIITGVDPTTGYPYIDGRGYQTLSFNLNITDSGTAINYSSKLSLVAIDDNITFTDLCTVLWKNVLSFSIFAGVTRESSTDTTFITADELALNGFLVKAGQDTDWIIFGANYIDGESTSNGAWMWPATYELNLSHSPSVNFPNNWYGGSQHGWLQNLLEKQIGPNKRNTGVVWCGRGSMNLQGKPIFVSEAAKQWCLQNEPRMWICAIYGKWKEQFTREKADGTIEVVNPKKVLGLDTNNIVPLGFHGYGVGDPYLIINSLQEGFTIFGTYSNYINLDYASGI